MPLRSDRPAHAPARERAHSWRAILRVAKSAGLFLAIGATVAAGASFSVSDLRIVEGHTGTTEAYFRVSLSGPIAQPATVHVQAVDGSASSQSDFAPLGTDLVFMPTPGAAAKWGGRGAGPGQFLWPRSVAVSPNGDVYVVDSLNCRVQKFDADGNLQLTWGSQGNLDGQLERPSSVAVDDSGNVFVADEVNRVQKFDALGQFLLSWPGGWNGSWEPISVAVDTSGNVFVLSGPWGSVGVFDRDGIIRWGWGAAGARALAVSRRNEVFVVYANENRVRVHGERGHVLREWGSSGCGDGQMNNPTGIALDAEGNVYVADTGNHRIQKFDSDGNFLLTWGMPGSVDGSLLGPRGIAVGPAGVVYVAEHNQHRVQKFTPSTGVPWAQRLRVPVQPDFEYEPSDSFFVELSNPVGASLGHTPAVGAIVDDDEIPLGMPPGSPSCLWMEVRPNGARGPLHGRLAVLSATPSAVTFLQGVQCLADESCTTDSISTELQLGVSGGRFCNRASDPLEWAIGTVESPVTEFLEFDSLVARYGTPAPGRNMVLHDLATGTMLDIQWLSWGEPGLEGYSYTRSGVVRSVVVSADFSQSVLPNELDISTLVEGTAWLVVTAAPEAGGTPTRNELSFPHAGESQLVVNCSCGITIAASAEAHGSIVPSGSVPVSCGGLQAFTIVPDSGCVIASIAVDNVPRPVTETVTFTDVREPHSIVATFSDVSPPAVRVVFPNGDSPEPENFVVGNEVVLAYEVADNGGAVANVQLEVSRDEGVHWQTIAASTPNTGTYAWTVTRPTTNGYSQTPLYSARLRVTATDEGGNAASDTSDHAWSIFEAPAAPPAPEVGAWSEFLPGVRRGATATYDPVRERMIVFGGQSLGSGADVWELSLVGPPAWSQLHPIGSGPRLDQPPGRYQHSAVYDPLRDRIVFFGGLDPTRGVIDDVWALSLADCPKWTKLEPLGPGPAARHLHTAIYDPVRDRMLVQGGQDPGRNQEFQDVWSLSLDDTPTWTDITPSGAGPSPRHGHVAWYDPVGDRLVVHGGTNEYDYFADLWALPLTPGGSWSELAPAGTAPSGRFWHTSAVDTARGRVVLYGGQSGWSARYDDVWTLTLGPAPAWSPLVTSGEHMPIRDGHSAIFEPGRDRMIVFGGADHTGWHNDLWTVSFANGAEAGRLGTMSGTPGPRTQHAAVYDSQHGRMVLFGGVPSVGGVLDDVWALSLVDGSAWSRLLPPGSSPLDRYGCAAIYDPVRDRLLVFGGEARLTGERNSEVWALSLSGAPTWGLLTTTGAAPGGRVWHRLAYDAVRDRMLLFGGDLYTSGPIASDVWALSLSGTPEWTQLSTSGTPPSPRYGASVLVDPINDRLLLFGGVHADYRNDLWALSLSGEAVWSELTPAGALPMVRSDHSAIFDPVRQRMVVFGGFGFEVGSPDIRWMNDAWSLSLVGAPEWAELVTPEVRPGPRYFHTAIYDAARDRMVVFGGMDQNQLFAEPWALTWSPSVSSSSGENGTIEPSGTKAVSYGNSASFTMRPNGGFAVQDVRVNGTSVGPVNSYTLTHVTCDCAIRATFVATTAVEPESGAIQWSLGAPYPNPARGGRISTVFSLPSSAQVRLEVFDASGRRIQTLAQGEYKAGRHALDAALRTSRPGLYWLRLRADGRQLAKRVVVVP